MNKLLAGRAVFFLCPAFNDDAFGEQRKLTTLGEGGSHTALEQAKAFIERQDARKQIWGGR